MGFRLANIGGRAALVDGEHYYDLQELSKGQLSSDPMAALESLGLLSELAARLSVSTATGVLADVTLGPPVPRPSNCFAIGLNYRTHAEEAKLAIPSVPMVFTKHSSCLNGPTGDIEMRSDYVDYEAELVVVIGQAGKDIKESNAWDHVAGLCVGQDVSDRPVQLSSVPPQFNLGKSFDTFGPIGPVLTSPDLLDNPDSLNITCKVNGELRQSDNTGGFIFTIPAIIAYLSEITTLRTGDLIFTGTPAGVALTNGHYLRDGDVVTTTIEGLGTLQNQCVRISDHSQAKQLPELYRSAAAALKHKSDD